MADISKIKTIDGTIYDIKDTTARAQSGVTGVKGSAETSYRTGNVNLTADNVYAIPKYTNGNTQQLYRPSYLRGATDNTLDAKINTLRANRLAFLPADQIIIEKTTDGGTTWVDAGVADSTKVGLFSETRAGVNLPLLNGVKSLKCGIRITITAMKYNVPNGTAETAKYNYWNSNYVLSAERYNQLKEMYFWVTVNSDTMGVKVERATGAASTTWVTAFDDSAFLMTGWSGNDYLRFGQNVFGGGTNQTTNYWNYRFTFMTKGTVASNGATLATTYTTSSQSLMEIRAYGDTWWTAGNEYAANDKLYRHDYLKNAFFPGSIVPEENGTKNLGTSALKWGHVYAGTFSGNLSGTADTATNVSTTGSASNSTARHIWFSDSSTETRRAYSESLKYTPSTNTISTNVSGTAANVTGTVAIANGGTGQTTAAGAANAIFGGLPAWTADPTDDTYLPRQDTGGSESYGKVKFSTVWNYIKSKISSVLGLTVTNYGGTSAKATADASGNTITTYYAPKSTAVTNVAHDTTNHKITKTINGTTTDVITAATTSAYGITKLNTATNSTSTTEAATPSAVKTAYDLANTANGTANTALSGVNGNLIYDHTYTISNGVATFTPHVYQKGSEVTTSYAKSCFTWKYRLIDGSEVSLTTKNDRGCDVTITNLGYGGHVIGLFTPA